MSSQSPMPAVPGDADAEHSGGNTWPARLLIAGVAVTAIAITPSQVIFSDTVKSITAAFFTVAALIVWAWGFRSNPRARWSPYLLAPTLLAITAASAIFWSNPYAAALESGRWTLITLAIFVGINSFNAASFALLSRTLYATAVLCSVVAMVQFWVGLSWLSSIAEPGSTFSNRNFFAEYIAAIIPVIAWTTLSSQSNKQSTWKGLSTGLILTALLCTGSRAAIITSIFSIIVISMIFLTFKNRLSIPIKTKKTIITAGTIAATVLAIGFIPSLNEKVIAEKRGFSPLERAASRLGSVVKDSTYEVSSSFGMRIVAWRASVNMVESHPLRGVGAGAWNTNLPLHTPADIKSDVEYVWHAHNEPLQLLAEYGLVGWAAIGGLGLLAAMGTRRVVSAALRKEDQDASQSVQEALLLLALVAMAMTSQSGLPLHAPATNMWMAVLIAMLLSHQSLLRSMGQVTKNDKRMWTSVPLACSLGILLIIAIQSVNVARADFIFLSGYKELVAAGLPNTPQKPHAEAQIKSATEKIRRSLDIYSDQGNYMSNIAIHLGDIGEHETMIWFTDAMLRFRPHTVALKCSKAISLIETNRLEEALILINSMEAPNRKSFCKEYSGFVYTIKTNDRAGTAIRGSNLLRDHDKIPDDLKKYIVESTYRAAASLNDHTTAIQIIQLRAKFWPQLRAHSQLLEGILRASLRPKEISPEALNLFKNAVQGARPAERKGIIQGIPEAYRTELKLTY